ncbi:unnamed protein product [Ixodes persulcatus]
MQAHLVEELRAQNEKLMSSTRSACDGAVSFHKPETYYWYFRGWEALKTNASKKGKKVAKNSPLYACGYRVFPSIIIIKKDGQLKFGNLFWYNPWSQRFETSMALQKDLHARYHQYQRQRKEYNS